MKKYFELARIIAAVQIASSFPLAEALLLSMIQVGSSHGRIREGRDYARRGLDIVGAGCVPKDGEDWQIPGGLFSENAIGTLMEFG